MEKHHQFLSAGSVLDLSLLSCAVFQRERETDQLLVQPGMLYERKGKREGGGIRDHDGISVVARQRGYTSIPVLPGREEPRHNKRVGRDERKARWKSRRL
jgi:hypothetical protein